MSHHSDTLSPAEELLILSVKDGRSPEELDRIRLLYADVGDQLALRVAMDNKLVPMMAHGLMDAIGETNLPAHWIEAHQVAYLKTTAFLEELDRLSWLLTDHGVPTVVIENSGIARGVYPCRGCFASNDLEILVDRRHLSLVDQILIENGYERASRERCMSEDPARWDRDIRGWDNYRKVLDGDIVFWINLQWRPILRRWLPMGHELSTTELIARSVQITEDATCVRLLSPEDNLLVCALHTASHSYVRGPGVRLQLDVDRLVRRVSIDWDVFLSRAKSHEVAAIAFPSLAIPKALFGTPIPDRVLNDLVPSAQRRRRIMQIIERTSVFNRGPHKFSPLKLIWLEAHLCDDGVLAGLFRVFFPPVEWMQEGYGFRNKLALPYYYAHRLTDLARRGPV